MQAHDGFDHALCALCGGLLGSSGPRLRRLAFRGHAIDLSDACMSACLATMALCTQLQVLVLQLPAPTPQDSVHAALSKMQHVQVLSIDFQQLRCDCQSWSGGRLLQAASGSPNLYALRVWGGLWTFQQSEPVPPLTGLTALTALHLVHVNFYAHERPRQLYPDSLRSLHFEELGSYDADRPTPMQLGTGLELGTMTALSIGVSDWQAALPQQLRRLELFGKWVERAASDVELMPPLTQRRLVTASAASAINNRCQCRMPDGFRRRRNRSLPMPSLPSPVSQDCPLGPMS